MVRNSLSSTPALGAGFLCSVLAACSPGAGLDHDIDPSLHVGVHSAASTFNWGSDCSAGDREMNAFVAHRSERIIGSIPAHKRDVLIALESDEDVDIRLIDKATGHLIVAWPDGDLSGAGPECTMFAGVEYCYSGYNGNGRDLGHEWIEVRGDTNRALEVRAYGFTAGDAQVRYAWLPAPVCNEIGSGAFEQYIPEGERVVIGDIAPGKVGVSIELRADADVDIELYDGEVAIVHWEDGVLSGPRPRPIDYEGMRISWSGFGGDGTGAGNEYIRIEGQVTRPLTMKAFGFEPGLARVTYEWGMGAGASCGSFTLEQCAPGFVCKNGETGNIAADVPGTCHTANWCESNASAASDCAGLIHIAVPGRWGCDTFQCVWRADLPQADLTCSMVDQSCPSGYTCEWGCPGGGNCGINPPGVCRRECASDAECSESEYCADSGVCRQDGTCTAAEECLSPANDWDRGACIAIYSWRAVCTQDATCAFACVPF